MFERRQSTPFTAKQIMKKKRCGKHLTGLYNEYRRRKQLSEVAGGSNATLWMPTAMKHRKKSLRSKSPGANSYSNGIGVFQTKVNNKVPTSRAHK